MIQRETQYYYLTFLLDNLKTTTSGTSTSQIHAWVMQGVCYRYICSSLKIDLNRFYLITNQWIRMGDPKSWNEFERWNSGMAESWNSAKRPLEDGMMEQWKIP